MKLCSLPENLAELNREREREREKANDKYHSKEDHKCCPILKYVLPAIAGCRKIAVSKKELSLVHNEPTLITFLITSLSKIACYYYSTKTQLVWIMQRNVCPTWTSWKLISDHKRGIN